MAKNTPAFAPNDEVSFTTTSAKGEPVSRLGKVAAVSPDGNTVFILEFYKGMTDGSHVKKRWQVAVGMVAKVPRGFQPEKKNEEEN